MLRQVSNYGNNAAALEKTLRLAQSLSQIAGGLAISPKDAVPWNGARAQFALSRRFFRLHKWIDCWSTAYTHFSSENEGNVVKMLETFKWSFHGLYFFLEMFTVTNAMGITTASWSPRLTQESNKFWFYALATSILLSLVQLFASSSLFETPAQSTTNEKVESTTSEKKTTTQKPEKCTRDVRSEVNKAQIYKQLVIDGSDIVIPGAVVGWIPADQVTVGAAMALSSILAGRDIWIKVNEVRPK